MIEPSDYERAGLPDTTRDYLFDLEKQNAELLEALKKMVLVFDVGMGNSAEEKEALEEARAAIKKVENA